MLTVSFATVAVALTVAGAFRRSESCKFHKPLSLRALRRAPTPGQALSLPRLACSPAAFRARALPGGEVAQGCGRAVSDGRGSAGHAGEAGRRIAIAGGAPYGELPRGDAEDVGQLLYFDYDESALLVAAAPFGSAHAAAALCSLLPVIALDLARSSIGF
jgi:hypothetical protein